MEEIEGESEGDGEEVLEGSGETLGVSEEVWLGDRVGSEEGV